jgi:hypothetical protein
MRATIARDWPNWGDRFAPKKVCGYGTPPAPDDGGAVMNREIELREAACRSGSGGRRSAPQLGATPTLSRRHCERSEAIQLRELWRDGLLRCARNDERVCGLRDKARCAATIVRDWPNWGDRFPPKKGFVVMGPRLRPTMVERS